MRSVANSSLTVARIDIDLKFKMGGRIETILMCVKFGDDPISSLDFSFIGGGCTLNFILNKAIDR